MSYSRVKLAAIPALTLYNDEPTLSRRGQPIPQLICKGKPCKLFTPDHIRCVNLGGEGANVDWKMSCEGSSGPGDSYVLKESCPLEYRPQEVPNVLRSPVLMTTPGILFLGVCIAVLAYTLYKYLLPCLEGDHRSSTSRTPRPGPSSGSGWFPGAMTITVVALRHLTQNIQTIPQSPPVRGGRIKTVWAFGAELRSAVWELTS